jgi:hypothetical protein
MLMQYGAQLDEPAAVVKGMSCLEHALSTKDFQLLSLLLSCLDKMTPLARQHLENVIAKCYDHANDGQTWLSFLAAKGLEVVPYMGKIVIGVPEAPWPEVRRM